MVGIGRHRRGVVAASFLLVAASCWMGVKPVAAAEVKVGGRPLAFEPPSGYCLYDKNRPKEEKAIADTRRLSAPHEIAVWVFGECARRDQWFSTVPSAMGRAGTLLVTRRPGFFRDAETMPRAAFVAEVARSQSWRVLYQDIEKRSQATQTPIRVNAIQPLARDDMALYIGVTYALPTRQGWKTAVSVSALTTVNSLPVIVDLADFGGKKTMTALLKQQKINVRALIKRNEQNEMRAAQASAQATKIAAAQ